MYCLLLFFWLTRIDVGTRDSHKEHIGVTSVEVCSLVDEQHGRFRGSLFPGDHLTYDARYAAQDNMFPETPKYLGGLYGIHEPHHVNP